jgi:hypothetical protein
MHNAILGFASGVGVSILAALFKTALDRHTDRRRRIEATVFDVYSLMLELYASYFYIACSEASNDQTIQDRVRDLALQIREKLRHEDRVPMIREILRVLFLEEAYPTASDRHDAMSALLEALEEFVTPNLRYLAR